MLLTQFILHSPYFALTARGVNSISFRKLNEYGITVERKCIEKDVEAVLIFSSAKINDAIYNFSDYFSLGIDESTSEPIVKINKDTNVDNLQERFIGYLPLDIIKILLQEARSIAG